MARPWAAGLMVGAERRTVPVCLLWRYWGGASTGGTSTTLRLALRRVRSSGVERLEARTTSGKADPTSRSESATRSTPRTYLLTQCLGEFCCAKAALKLRVTAYA